MSQVSREEPAIQHAFFSFSRLWAIATNTLTELVRLRVFYFLLIFALLLIVGSLFWSKVTFQQQLQTLKDISLGAMTIFSTLLAMLATAMMLPKDMEDRTLYTILAKPVPRFEYLMGKLTGILLLLGLAILAMSLVFGITLMIRYFQVAQEMQGELGASAAELMQPSVDALRAEVFDPDLLLAIALLYLKAAIFAAVTLFLSTISSSWIFTVMMAAIVYLIGHFQGEAREYLMLTSDGSWLSQGFLGIVVILFPDLQLFNLVDDIVVGAGLSLSLAWKTVALGLFYFIIYTAASYLAFSSKEY